MKPTVLNKLTITAISGAILAFAGTVSAETIELKALGQPSATGEIHKNKEVPFFAEFAERTGLDVKVNMQPLDQTGIKAAEELRVLKSGLFDIVSLRFQQVSRDEPMLLGMDLVGQNPTYADGKASVEAFSEKLDKRLQEKFNTKLLGTWPFGPQVLFCKPEIKSLKDISGLKVRTYDQNLANFVSSLGGTPVPLGFADVHQSLARGVVDCAITGPSSANSAAWPEVTSYVLPLAFNIAIQGYGINLKTWNKFNKDDQAKIAKAFDELSTDIWAYSEELFDDAMRCNVGATPCELNKPYKLVGVPVSDADMKIAKDAVKDLSFPAFAETCDKTNPNCSAEWKSAFGERFGM